MNLTTSYVVNGDDFPVNNINDLLPVHDDSIHSDGPGIPVGSKVLAQQRKVLLTEMGTEGFLRIILTPLKPLYDYIIIDTNWATSPLMINARTAVDGDGAHLFCFRLTFCIHPDIIKITSEYSWYTGAYPIVMGEKGSRVRIPHKAVAVLAEGSPDVTGAMLREGGDRAGRRSQNTCLRMTHTKTSPSLRGCRPPAPSAGDRCCTLFGLCSFFAARRPP